MTYSQFELTLFMILACLLTFLAMMAVRDHEIREARQSAIQRGHAYWLLNTNTGGTTFTWKTNCVCMP